MGLLTILGEADRGTGFHRFRRQDGEYWPRDDGARIVRSPLYQLAVFVSLTESEGRADLTKAQRTFLKSRAIVRQFPSGRLGSPPYGFQTLGPPSPRNETDDCSDRKLSVGKSESSAKSPVSVYYTFLSEGHSRRYTTYKSISYLFGANLAFRIPRGD